MRSFIKIDTYFCYLIDEITIKYHSKAKRTLTEAGNSPGFSIYMLSLYTASMSLLINCRSCSSLGYCTASCFI